MAKTEKQFKNTRRTTKAKKYDDKKKRVPNAVEKVKAMQKEQREKREAEHKLREKQKLQQKAKRMEKTKVFLKKTKRGQPLMKDRINHLLEKIKEMKSNNPK